MKVEAGQLVLTTSVRDEEHPDGAVYVHPRRADVVALTYCTLLELRSGDFRKFLKANPHISERIDQVAQERGVKRVA